MNIGMIGDADDNKVEGKLVFGNNRRVVSGNVFFVMQWINGRESLVEKIGSYIFLLYI